MVSTTLKEASVKYTTVLPKVCIDELKSLTDKKVVPSVSQGIRLAIESFIALQKQQAYEHEIQAAMDDEAFVQRTMDTQNDFSVVDEEGAGTW